MKYQPKPLNTEGIILPQNIIALAEKLAENTHDVWAQRRMQEGWTHGPQWDDINKKHPCLVPYGELQESEKDYDRSTSLETLKCILLMGYKIVQDESSHL